MANSFLQVRTNDIDKQMASEILEDLGTNLSTVVNMLLKQIVITRSIPFEIKLDSSTRVSPYRINDVKAILEIVPNSVEELWVFGSSVTEYCKPESDLDICIIGHTTMTEESKMYKAAKCAVDIITETPEGFKKAREIPGSVYKEVAEKGLLVYKKGKNIEWNKTKI